MRTNIEVSLPCLYAFNSTSLQPRFSEIAELENELRFQEGKQAKHADEKLKPEARDVDRC